MTTPSKEPAQAAGGEAGDIFAPHCRICADRMHLIVGDEVTPDVYRCDRCNKEEEA